MGSITTGSGLMSLLGHLGESRNPKAQFGRMVGSGTVPEAHLELVKQIKIRWDLGEIFHI